MKKLPIAVLFFSTLILLCSLFFRSRLTIDDFSKLSDSDSIELYFNNQKLDLEIAKSNNKLESGLMNKTHLEANSGMFFIFQDEAPRIFWMKNTLISLDIIYLDKNLKVVNFYKSTIPDQVSTTYPSINPSQYVIETNSGWIQAQNLKIGDNFSL